MNEPKAYITTYTGGMFDILEPLKSHITIHDIAHSLSMQCRFNGHSRCFYSVAEHSYQASFLVSGSKFTKLGALMHDAAEAFMSDIPTPVKRLFPEIYKVEEKIVLAIFELLELDYEAVDWAKVKEVDRLLLLYEQQQIGTVANKHKAAWGPWQELYPNQTKIVRGELNSLNIPLPDLEAWEPEHAKHAFISRFNELTW